MNGQPTDSGLSLKLAGPLMNRSVTNRKFAQLPDAAGLEPSKWRMVLDGSAMHACARLH